MLDKNKKYHVSFSIKPTDGDGGGAGGGNGAGGGSGGRGKGGEAGSAVEAAAAERGAHSDGEAVAPTQRQEQTGGSAPGDPDRHTHAKSL